jgi:hypothetical protein
MTASRFLRAAIPAALAFLAAAPLFAAPITPVVTLSTVADTGTTLIPGGTGTFTSFNPGPTAERSVQRRDIVLTVGNVELRQLQRGTI